MKCYPQFVLKMQEKHLIPSSTVHSIMNDVSHLFEVAGSHQVHKCQKTFEQTRSTKWSENWSCVCSWWPAIWYSHSNTWQWVETKCNITKKFDYVEPESYVLGRNEKKEQRAYHLRVLVVYSPLAQVSFVLSQTRGGCTPGSEPLLRESRVLVT